MSYRTINIYDNVTREIVTQVKLDETRVVDYFADHIPLGHTGVYMGAEAIPMAEDIEFSNPANPRADNVRKRPGGPRRPEDFIPVV